ncbi:DUF262 domain-containing protein [Tsukamurella pseudospumae]|uniref:GmrSD restriction endonucleases N-terminal domain-containing protein n=1 Tax=Tsukamurella pseudospumae TaxID=239498 RepID=A0A137YWZ1_9ACTN|nr:DUF262 domain-containing protein [Tsukamurella pseudospumae]KXO90460.1 hypothetical protein AXK61_07525 [Tsukamurella pseudospumae]
MDHDERVAAADDRTLRDDELEDLIDVERSPARVTFSTQDMSIDALVKRINRKSMLVPQFGGADELVQVPGFQRGFVWSKAQMDKFIESLLLGYPVPGLFLVKQTGDNRMLILDGQQRLITLQRFYKGTHEGKVFALSYVADEFKGLTYDTLDESLQFKLDDSYMQATIVSADGSEEVNDSIFQIFERLNSGGTQLTPHEIRVALYAGELMASIERLNSDENWRILFAGNNSKVKSKRIRDHELILRIMALYTDSGNYNRPLKTFLNKFAGASRTLDMSSDRRGHLFLLACEVVNREVGPTAFRRASGNQVNTAQAEAVMVAVMEILERGDTPTDLSAKFIRLVADDEFLKSSGRATADKDAVESRLSRARHFLG